MAPGGGGGNDGGGGRGGKRKRVDRTFSQDDGQSRPSPHRPENLNLAQHNQRYDGHGSRGDNRRGRGRGNYNNNGNSNYNNNNHGSNNNYNNNNHNSHNAQHSASTPSRSTPSAAPSPAPTPASAKQDAQAATPAPASAATSTPAPVHATPAPAPAAAPAPAPVAAPAPVQRPVPMPQNGPPKPYPYDYLTKPVIARWQESGRQKVLDDFAQAGPEDEEFTASMILQELLRATLDGKLSPSDAGSAFKAMMDVGHDKSALESLFADTISTLTEEECKTPTIRAFVLASEVSQDFLRSVLDGEVLMALALVRMTFVRSRNRKTTNMIYRQQNYNLLREESEGYSKLITEYFNTSSASSLSDSSAEDAFQRIKALVGSFDLDVGRVLDITLDVFANLLVRQYRFFVKFLRASSWWPENTIPEGFQWTTQDLDSLPGWALPGSGIWGTSMEERERLAVLKQERDVAFWQRVRQTGLDAFFQLGARKITNLDSPSVQELLNTEVSPEYDGRKNETNFIRRSRTNNDRKWMRETGCLVPRGNADAAQLLGFKLGFYSSAARDKNDVLPDNLVFLAALLIKIGFISLRDLYPHLYPPDAKMADVKEKLIEEKTARERAARPGGLRENALASAGALADDTLPVPAVRALREAASGRASPKSDDKATPAPEDDADKLPEPADQKIALLKSLLLIGALPEALYILGRFPWLADLVPDLPDYINRICHHMLSKVYEPARPLRSREGLSDSVDHIGDPAGLPKGSVKFVSPPQKKTLRWANLERGDLGDGIEYKFYWDDWTDNIPVCQNVDDVFQLCSTFLNLTGVKIGRDPTLLMKLVRIGKWSLTEDTSVSNQQRWIDLCKRLLVPAISLTKRNTGAVNETFELLKFFPTSVRYSIYAEWHFGPTSRLPDIKAAFDLTKAETKDVLKRISKTNVRAMGKALSKVAFSSPGIVMQVAIHQMESYDNLIDVVVECVRYFSILGYDVLTWCLMNALGSGGRNRQQADGMLTSAWLRALSNFAGAIFKRYSAIDPSPILQYVANELHNGNSTDLEVLEQIITGMAGIKSDIAFNESQVLAMAGGKVLQAQTLIRLLDERHNNVKSSKRLIKALVEPKLAGPLLISIAQERQMYPHHASEEEAPLKVLGNNLDKIHQVFAQYLDTLRSNLAAKEFDEAVPDIASLIIDFGLEPAVAFMIGRSSVAQHIADIEAARKADEQDKLKKSSGATNGDVAMADAEVDTDIPMDELAEDKSAGTPVLSLSETDAEMKQLAQSKGVAVTPPAPGPNDDTNYYWHPALTSAIEKIRARLGSDLESSIDIPFYVTFWTLSLEDILVNTSSYDQEIAHQNQLVTLINNDRGSENMKSAKDKESKKKAILEVKEQLVEEMRAQIASYQATRHRLIKEKDHWFPSFTNKVELLHTSLLQNCFLPRVLMSPIDAHYTFTMIKFLHNSGTSGFRTMHLYDRMLRKNQIATIIYQCTPREAENFGRFLHDVLKDLSAWHADKKVYDKNALGRSDPPKATDKKLSGFARKLDADGAPETFLEYEDFRRLLWKWHGVINNAFKDCFESGEYMRIRNAFIVLKAVVSQFPAINFMGSMMFKMVTTLSQEEKRADLKLAANSLLGDLKKREKSWMLPQAFRIVSEEEKQRLYQAANQWKNDNMPAAQRSGTPVSRNSTPLNPAASEFKLPTSTVTNDNGSEDGEVDEEKKADTTTGEPAPAPQKEAAKNEESMEEASDAKAELNVPAEPTKTESTRGTPVPSAPPVSNSQPPSRPPSTKPNRVQHALPTKPDLRTATRAPERAADRLPRNAPQPNYARESGRLDRPSDLIPRVPSSMSRDQSPNRRGGRAWTPESHDRGRDYRAPHGRPDDIMPSRPQDMRLSERDGRYPRRGEPELPIHPGRSTDARGYTNGASAMGPPSQPDRGYSRDRGSLPPTGRTPSHGPPTPGSEAAAVAVNPERAALINGGPGSRDDRRQRDMPARADRDDRRDRGSRPQSPYRGSENLGPSRAEQREPERRAPLEPNPFQARNEREWRDEHSHREPAEHAPTGPRGGRTARPEAVAKPPSRGDLFASAGPRRSNVDENFGRLEQPSDHAPPSGPRTITGPSGRFNSGPNSAARAEPPPQAPPQSPTGPRGSRGPTAASRQPSNYDRAPAAAAPSTPAPGVHPDRLQHLNIEQSHDTRAPPSGPASYNTPSGPRSVTGGPSGPASQNPPSRGSVPVSTTTAPPSGPGGRRSQIANINDTLTAETREARRSSRGLPVAATQPQSQQGMSIRGNASVPSSPNVNVPNASVAQNRASQQQFPPANTNASVHPARANLVDPSANVSSDRSDRRRGAGGGVVDDDSRDRSHRSHNDDRDRHPHRDPRDRDDGSNSGNNISGGRRNDRDRTRNDRDREPARTDARDRNDRDRRGGMHGSSSGGGGRDDERGVSAGMRPPPPHMMSAASGPHFDHPSYGAGPGSGSGGGRGGHAAGAMSGSGGRQRESLPPQEEYLRGSSSGGPGMMNMMNHGGNSGRERGGGGGGFRGPLGPGAGAGNGMGSDRKRRGEDMGAEQLKRRRSGGGAGGGH